MAIRKFVPGDLPKVLEVYQRAFAGPTWREALELAEVQRRWNEQVGFTNFNCFVATEGKRVIGATWWNDIPLEVLVQRHVSATALRAFVQKVPHERLQWIWETIVDPDYQNHGIARSLKVAVLNEVRKSAQRTLVMTRMREDNVRIRSLNQNLGMRPSGVFQACSLTPGMQHQFWYLVTAPRRPRIGVLGASKGNLPEAPALAERMLQCAEEVGFMLAQHGALVFL
jgi:RimJ/RimL family protein N-acetyltransferase